MRDTCEIHVSARVIRYMRDTSKIHDEIHVSQMHPERDVSDMKETCGIHARYMRDTCILRGNQDTCGIHAEYMRDTCEIHVSSEVTKIHAGYMRDTCGIHSGYMRDTYLGCLGYPSAAASRARDTYPRMYPYVSETYRECILCVMYLRVKIHCILNVS